MGYAGGLRFAQPPANPPYELFGETVMTLTDASRLKLLEPPVGRLRVVLDTDTYNEIDDQFALVQMLLSKDRFDVEAIYAAPFFNARADSPAHGMELSYQEILRLLERLNVAPDHMFAQMEEIAEVVCRIQRRA